MANLIMAAKETIDNKDSLKCQPSPLPNPQGARPLWVRGRGRLTFQTITRTANQISEPSAFRKNMGLVGVPILAGPQTWFQSLLFKDYGFS